MIGGLQNLGGDRFIQMLTPTVNSTSQPAIPDEIGANTSCSFSQQPIVEPMKPLTSTADEKKMTKKKRPVKKSSKVRIITNIK